MTEPEHFYRERDNGIILYLHGRAINQIPVHVLLDQEANASQAGQACLLALTNQLARVHRNICFILPSSPSPILVPTLFPAGTLADTVIKLACRIDPCGSFTVRSERPEEHAISIGLGKSIPLGQTWYIGAAGAVAYLDRSPCALDVSNPVTILGAGLASCLGASAIFRSALELPTIPRKLSCWNYKEAEAAEIGPEAMVPLDVGKTLVVGIGAVGSALIHWLHLFGAIGDWDLVDGDQVEVKNTSRQILFVPEDAGWPNRKSAYKCDIASNFLPNSHPHREWYDVCQAIKNQKYDVVLALANERDVRTRLARRNPAVLLHATTGQNWLSQLHRHILGADDCIRCRMNDVREPRLGCSSATLPAKFEGDSTDAALPFLSAASGLMLATALMKLQLSQLHTFLENDWRWDFDSTHKMVSTGKHACGDGCEIVPSSALRRDLNRGTRWGHLIQ